MTTRTGPLQYEVSWDDYQHIPGISISRLKELARSPKHYRHRLMFPKESPAMTLGTAAHTAVLEPERFDTQFAIWDRRSKSGKLCPRNGQFWDAFLADNPGKTILSDVEAVIAEAIRTAVRGYPPAMRYLHNGDPEVVMQWDRRGLLCKGRVDWITTLGEGPVLVGLKTTRDVRHYQFAAQAARLGYHLQWAFYHDGFEKISGSPPRVVEIVVESEPPHAVAVYSIGDDILEQGRTEYLYLLDYLSECEAQDEWRGPQQLEERLTLPTWAYAADEAGEDLADLELA